MAPAKSSIKAKCRKQYKTGKARGKCAFREGFKRFQPYRNEQIEKFRKAKGHKPRTVADWISINKKAGVAYRREN